MDQFTENILERARERQRKLQEIKDPEKGTPLRDSNINIKNSAKKTSVSQPNLTEVKQIPRKEVVSDSNIFTKVTMFDSNLKENKSEGNLSPFKRNSSTRVSSHLPGSPQLLVKTLNIQKDDFNMEIKLSSSDNVRVEVEIQEEGSSDEEDCGTHKDMSGDAENTGMRAQVKNKLQKLGRLYAGGEDADISSPITRTEEKFHTEDVDDEEETPRNNPQNSRKGLNKLADLAQSINNWEDDLSVSKREVKTTPKKSWKPPAPQPPTTNVNKKSPAKTKVKPPAPKPPVIAKSPAKSQNVASVDRPGSSQKNEKQVGATPKQLKWDKNVLETLESQGFIRTTSNSKLVYKYAADSQENKAAAKQAGFANAIDEESESEEILVSKAIIKLSNEQIAPKSPVKGRSTAIANKAALFESPVSSPNKNTKDPALLSISERMALFEKNKGSALIPKAPLGMAAPVMSKKLDPKPKPNISNLNTNSNNSSDRKMAFSLTKSVKPVASKLQIINSVPKDSPTKKAIAESGGIASKVAALLNKKTTISQEQIASSVKEQRQKEMDVLLNRFNKKKDSDDLIEEDSDEEDANETTKMINRKAHQIVPKVEIISSPESKNPSDKRRSGEKRPKKGDSPQVAAVLEDVKRIKVAEPKEGNLYPCLSDIEANTETEPEPETASHNTSSLENSYYESDEGNTSFGREILQVVCRNQTPQKRPVSNESESDVSDILDDMNEYLDEALAYESGENTPGPTPPKQGKISSQSKNTAQPSESFHYKRYSPKTSNDKKSPTKTAFKSPKVHTPKTSNELPTHIMDGDNILPLTHTVSFYRKQQQTQVIKTPVRQVSTQPLIEESTESIPDESETVKKKIDELKDEVNKQLMVISQASQALNLCNSTPEFYGSTEQVEAEKLLLLATHRRQAAMHELQRLEVEGTLRPKGNGLTAEQGTLTITNITLPLKREYVRALAAAGGKGHHVVCLVKSGRQVFSTQLVSTVANSSKNPDLDLSIPGYVRFDNIYGDSAIAFEVYCLQAQQELLSHELKYHINKKGSNKSTPKKGKQDTRMILPPKESPAGPHAVRSPTFALMGYVVFSIQAKNRTQWTLNKTPSMSPLEGSVEMKVSCELNVSVEHRGFLTMFEDVSGFGAWHRRWCLLKGHTLSYWRYPDDERKKPPTDGINLKNSITKEVGPVRRDICARLHTLLLERERPAQNNDKDTLTTICKGNKTIVRHLLSADTKEERIEWSNMLNKALMAVRLWNAE